MQSEHSSPADDHDVALTPTDLTIIDALSSSSAGRLGVTMLRGAAALIAVIGIAGSILTAANYLSPGNSDSLFADPEPILRRWGVFFTELVLPLALAAIVLGLSHLLAINRSRLELAVVTVEQEEPDTGEE